MAKQPNTRKKSVMQDVHPDVIDRIEDWTDPEAIEHARKRIVDYAKVAERFAAADLPEEDEDLDTADSFVSPIVPETVLPASDDLNLLQDLEDLNDAPSVPQSSSSDDLNDADFDDLEDLLRQTDDVPPTPAPEGSAELADFDELDTDLLDDLSQDDDNNHNLGQEAFGADAETDKDDDDSFLDDDIFGIPSTSQEPTPYGNRAQKEETPRAVREVAPAEDSDDDLDSLIRDMDQGAASGEDDFSDLADLLNSEDDKASQTDVPGQRMPAWMQDDNDDIPDILTPSQRRAADQDDSEESVFDAPEDDLSSLSVEEDDSRTGGRHVEPSSDALNEMLGLEEPEASSHAHLIAEAQTDAAPLSDDVSEKPKKKGLFSMFGRKKKVKDTVVETDQDTGVETETVTETIVDETPDGDVVVEENVSVTTVKKKSGLRKTAVSLLALAVIGGGAYVVADQAGYLDGPQPVVVQPSGPSDGPSDTSLFPPISGDEAEPVETGVQGGDDTPPVNDDQPLFGPNPDAPETSVPDESLDVPPPLDEPNGDGAQMPQDDLSDMGSAPASPTDVTEDETVVEDIEPSVPEVIEEGVTPENVTTDSPDTVVDGVPAAAVDALGDLYDVGVSESQVAEADAARMSAKLAELTTLLEEQGQALDSAMNRVKTLEAVMAERDATLATTQGEAETARQSAQEAKDMALAQNKVLIEVVGMRDKMQIAEDLIVELSQRTHSLESDDSETQQIRQLNERITELTRDVGLLARTVLTSGQNLADQKAAQAAADRAHSEAQAAVDANAESTINRQTQSAPSGSGAVYGNEGKLLVTPDASEIPDDVKIGDNIPGYGEVLDISEMEDGSRLVVMENNSKILPRK